MRRALRIVICGGVVAALSVGVAPAALAHDHRIFYEPKSQDVKANPITRIARTLPTARAASVSLRNPSPGKPHGLGRTVVLTRNPDSPSLTEPGFETPARACAPPSCSEIEVVVPPGGGNRTLYARAAWTQPNYYVHIWGISPEAGNETQDVNCTYIGDPNLIALQNCEQKVVVGRADVANSFNKETGNERTIPVSEFAVHDPAPGRWRIQTRAVFGYRVPVRTTVALAAGAPVSYERLGVRELADKYLTQRVSINVVFAGRRWSKAEVAEFRRSMPLEYRTGVLLKQGDDGCGTIPPPENPANQALNWQVCHYTGTASPDAEGYRPYFEPIKFRYSYSFLQADDRWTQDLYAKARSVTRQAAPFDAPRTVNVTTERPKPGASDYLALYDAQQGKLTRDAEHQVSDPTVSDKIDAFAVEDWIFSSRMNKRYARSFRNLETGQVRGGSFITPDPGAYFDPFYSLHGKDLETTPQGPATSYTFFVLDTYTPSYAAKYFRPNAYHQWDVSMHMIDPDAKEQDGPDWARVWGGRYRFFFHDIGAAPNPYEAVDFFLGEVPGSASKPNGDPPIWDYLYDPYWQGKLVERTARSAVTMLNYRFTPSYLYRPIPADVYFLASNNWLDCYSTPQCSPDGIAHTVLEKMYRPGYVEKNLSAALPGVTFTTERSDPRLKTYRYLGCASMRAVSNREGLSPALVPDPNCVGKPSDPIQEWLELAKARGDDVAGAGVSDFGASASVIRRLVEEHRNMIAPLRPGQQTLTNISVVFPGATTWDLPAIVGGVAFGTPNDEIWGILNNVNDRIKGAQATDCSKSRPSAPGCNGVPKLASRGFSYTVQHEASHFLGLLHPHDSLLVEKDSQGKWEYYGYSYRHYGDQSMAPTTYAGAFAPYSVLDQDIVQRGHTAEYLRMTQDTLADAYQQDGMRGLSKPSALSRRKVAEAARWRALASRLFHCGDYLKSERAMRNAFLAAQGTFGPVVKARALKPGEKVLFAIRPEQAFDSHGRPMKGCAGSRKSVAAAKRAVARPGGGSAAAARPPLAAQSPGSIAPQTTASRRPGVPADVPMVALVLITGLAVASMRRRRRS